MSEVDFLKILVGSIKKAYRDKDHGHDCIVLEYDDGKHIRISSECEMSYGDHPCPVPTMPDVYLMWEGDKDPAELQREQEREESQRIAKAWQKLIDDTSLVIDVNL